jgi:hypothetical protein
MTRHARPALRIPTLLVAVLCLSSTGGSFGQCEVHEVAKLSASDAAVSDFFGLSVSVSGNALVVGAPKHACAMGSECGSAYVFRLNGAAWVQEGELIPPDLAPSDYFGGAVAVDGDRIVVGARYSDPNALSFAGAAYVFRFDGTAWVQEAKLTAPDAAPGDVFGTSVAVQGDRVFVGAPGSGVDGALYIFLRQGTAWMLEGKLLPPVSCFENGFGYAISVFGDRVLVGWPGSLCLSNVASPPGAAFVFRREGTNWVFEAQLPRPPGIGFSGVLGVAVSLSDEVALVGHLFGQQDESAASVYRRSGTMWSFEALLGPLDAHTAQLSVATDGNAAVVGIMDTDAAHVFIHDGSNWPEVAQLTPTDAATGDYFGYAVSLSGNRVLLGAPGDDNAGGINAGSAYVFDLPHDCNANGVGDACDIAVGNSTDCDIDGIPDECEFDCNGNMVPDPCDIATGTSDDCNGNGVPDECDPQTDCNNNGIQDICDLAGGTSLDCNGDEVPDECQLGSNDCNANAVPDSCEIASGTSRDENRNNVPDECEGPQNVEWDFDPLSPDRTTRSLRFRVKGSVTATGEEIALKVTMVELQHPNPRNAVATVAIPRQTVPQNFSKFDTNSNGVCSGATATPNYNGQPCDPSKVPSNADCVCNTPSCASADPARSGVCIGNPAPPLVACTAAGEAVPPDASGQGGCARWVGKPATFLEAQEVPGLGNYRAARLQCTPFYYDWVTETAGNVCAGPLGPTNTGLPCIDDSGCTAPATCVPKKITVVGAEILPSSTYSVQTYGASCAGRDPALCSNLGAPVTMLTRRHGDVASTFTPPDVGQPSSIDVSRIVNAFGKKGPLRKVHAKITPNVPEQNLDVGAEDIGRVVDSAKGFAYPLIESGPCPCPSTVTCGATPCGCDAGPACAACGGGQCVKTCTDGVNDGLPCRDNDHGHCPGGTCGSGFCRDKCARCTP